jgi:predicted nucleic acid-binding protein
MKRLLEFLKSHPVVGLDTSIFIYHLEDHPRCAPATEIIFHSLEEGKNQGITSFLTLMEILVKPKVEDLPEVARDYEYYLTTFPNLTLFPFELEIARKASDLRAVNRFKTPDAIQLATALHHGATGFLTNDRMFEKVSVLEIAILDKVMK